MYIRMMHDVTKIRSVALLRCSYGLRLNYAPYTPSRQPRFAGLVMPLQLFTHNVVPGTVEGMFIGLWCAHLTALGHGSHDTYVGL